MASKITKWQHRRWLTYSPAGTVAGSLPADASGPTI